MMSLLMTLAAAVPAKEATFWMPESASTQAPFVDHVFDFINLLCYIFLVLITVVLVWFAIKYRQLSYPLIVLLLLTPHGAITLTLFTAILLLGLLLTRLLIAILLTAAIASVRIITAPLSGKTLIQ